jgi:hypothetical protein
MERLKRQDFDKYVEAFRVYMLLEQRRSELIDTKVKESEVKTMKCWRRSL